MIKCGYVRVSREDQNPENQIQLMIKEGIPAENIFVDKLSGISTAKNRPGFSKLFTFLHGKEDVILYVFEISRLGRSFMDTLNLVQDFEKRGIRVWSLSPAETFMQIRDQSMRQLILAVLSWTADRERETMIERTKLGLIRAKADGKNLGRPERILPKAEIRKLREKNISLSAISRILNVPYSTLRRNYKE